jgi:hypothetical protein
MSDILQENIMLHNVCNQKEEKNTRPFILPLSTACENEQECSFGGGNSVTENRAERAGGLEAAAGPSLSKLLVSSASNLLLISCEELTSGDC